MHPQNLVIAKFTEKSVNFAGNGDSARNRIKVNTNEKEH